MKPIDEAKNIGPTIAKALNEINIFTLQDLAKRTPVKAYVEICKNKQDKTVPLCYYLYSLQGALSNTDWRRLTKETKNKLRKEAEYLSK